MLHINAATKKEQKSNNKNRRKCMSVVVQFTLISKSFTGIKYLSGTELTGTHFSISASLALCVYNSYGDMIIFFFVCARFLVIVVYSIACHIFILWTISATGIQRKRVSTFFFCLDSRENEILTLSTKHAIFFFSVYSYCKIIDKLRGIFRGRRNV